MKAQQQGFVLAVVLWSIVALTLITGGMMATINGTLEQAYRMREIARQDREFFSTEQTLLYVLSTRPRHPAGIDLQPSPEVSADPFSRVNYENSRPTLRLDGSTYPGVGEVRFTLWSANGRFSLFEPRRDPWLRIMEVLGVSPSDADRWYDQWLDYMDRDELPRLNGAEAEAYFAAGLTPPPNRFPVSPHELRNLPIAQELPDATERLIALSTSRAAASVNLNTSPAQIIEAELGLERSTVDQLLERRSNQIYQSLPEVSSDLGVVLPDSLGLAWFPGSTIQIVLRDEAGPQRRWLAVDFTPMGDGQPWYVDYHHPVDFLGSPDARFIGPDSENSPFGNSSFATDSAPSAPAENWSQYREFFPSD